MKRIMETRETMEIIYMIAEVIIDLLTGLTLIVLGLLTWKKQQISLLHDYHYRNVRKEDVSAFARAMGIGQIVIGMDLCLTAVFILLTGSTSSWLIFAAGTIIGLLMFHRALMKYNGGWFS